MSTSQTDLVLLALREGPLTQLDALQKHGVMRLSARIYDLRHMGHSIAMGWREVGFSGERKRIAVYYLLKSAQS